MKKTEWVSRRIEFAYPDKNGKTEILGFDIFAKKEDSEKFDKYYNFLYSVALSSGLKAFPIYDVSDKKKSSKHNRLFKTK